MSVNSFVGMGGGGFTAPPNTHKHTVHSHTRIGGNLESSVKLMCVFLDFSSALQPSLYVDQLINRFCVVSGRNNFTLLQLNYDTASIFCGADINLVFWINMKLFCKKITFRKASIVARIAPFKVSYWWRWNPGTKRLVFLPRSLKETHTPR